MKLAMIAEPPYDMNGNGMPVIGMMPIVMPTFSKTWIANIASTPIATSVPKKSDDKQRDAPEPPREQRVEREQRRAADEAEVLPHRGEDEVGVLLGHEAVLRLQALAEAGAGEAARRDRGLRRLQVELRRA